MELKKKAEDKSLVIGVVGLGYVGLPLVLGYVAEGYRVIGFDVDGRKIKSLSAGESYIEHIPSAPIATAISNRRFHATSDFSEIAAVDAVIICVPTPLSRHHEPDLSYVITTTESITPFLRSGQLVSLESTTYPGTTEEELQFRIEAKGLEIGKDIFLVYSPEREDPGNKEFEGTKIPKVLGGTTEQCLQAGLAVYGAIYPALVPVSSPKVAEFTKLLENIYRSVNIGLVNELKTVADEMDVDLWEVIEAAKSKPFGFKAFYPGPGLGGHCIPIDPFYLTWKAKEFGIHTRFIELAGEVNESMPAYVIRRVAEALNRCRKPVMGSKVLLMGLAYKSDVDDMRESPTFHLMDLLKAQGAEISYYDPHIPEITSTREHAEWAGKVSIQWDETNISGFDCVIIATNHAAFNLQELAEWAPLIVDTRNALVGVNGAVGQIVKA